MQPFPSSKQEIIFLKSYTSTIEISGIPITCLNAKIENQRDQLISFGELNVGDWVEVEGVFDGNAGMTAREIEIQDSRQSELKGRVSKVDAEKSRLWVNGITIKVCKDTFLEGRRDEKIQIRQIKPGDEVECRGNWTGDREFTATEVELD